MNFAIVDGLPYLISNGHAYPVEIKDGSVRCDESQFSPTKERGGYSLREVIAKCGNEVSSIPKKQRAKKVDGE